MKLLEQQAREMAKASGQWHVYHWEHIDNGYLLIGAEAPLFKQGKRKGQTNWKLMDKKTEKKVFIATKEHEEWVKQWETNTGKCSGCMGLGMQVQSWSSTEGTVYRVCKKCGGNGLKKEKNATDNN
jgi:hypothetical protein